MTQQISLGSSSLSAWPIRLAMSSTICCRTQRTQSTMNLMPARHR